MAKVANEYLPLSVLGEFPNDWTEATLSQVCVQVTDGTHDSPKPQSIGGFPLVTGKAIKDQNIDFSVTYNISDDDHKKVIERSKAERDDILFANIGNSIGDLVRVQTDKEFSIKNVALFKPDLKVIQPRFLEYFLRSEIVQNFIKGSTRGSAQPFIGLGSLRGFPIALPPIDEQINIGNILGALDDRIALLRETNTTLETIAQTLFKSWFVDFDPVHAKQQGREPEGMDAATAALFPDSFGESEMGLIPKGWRAGKFGDFIDRQPVGKKYDNKSALSDGNVPILDQGRSGIIGFHNEAPSVKATLDSPIIVFANHTCYMRLISYDFSAIQNVLPFIGKSVDTVWAYYATKDRLKFSEYKGHWPDFVIEKAVIPDEATTNAFRSTVNPLIKRIRLTEQQAQSLTALRDTLLPRLISGQLRLPETEEMVEDVTV